MAEKEATVYVVDVGSSTKEKSNGRELSDLDWSLNYVWDKIAATIATGRKTACIGVVGFRTDVSDNELSEEESYKNISVFQPLGQMLMPNVRALQDRLKSSSTDSGDAISAIVIAIQMIDKFCKRLKYIRRIVVATNGTGSMDADQLTEIANKIKADNIEIVILGVDFDDPEYGFKEEGKSGSKAQNEATLKSLADECQGTFGTFAEAISELEKPRIKTVRPVPSYKGHLTLGDIAEYETAMSIDIERYPRTMVARAPAASSFVVRSDLAPGESSMQSSLTVENGNVGHLGGQNELSSIHNSRLYEVLDSAAPGGKLEVSRDNLARGYEYGRTAVHISESDRNVTQIETKGSLEILGFIPWDNYDHFMNLSNTNVIIAQRTNDKANMALGSLIHALYELSDYAIGKLITKDMRPPKLVLLAPSIEPDFECLIDVELPFAEDVRSYKFPPLDRIVTISGKILTEHRNLPSKDLQDAMGDFVDSMDLSKFGQDGEGGPAEYMPMEETFSLVLHRINQAVRFRATHPFEQVPSTYKILTKYSQPPEVLVKQSGPQLEKLQAAADVKKVPSRSLSRKRYRGSREQEQPRSGLDVSALLSSRASAQKNRISPENAVPEFKQAMLDAEDVKSIADAVTQLGAIIKDWIRHSVGDSRYGRAVEGIRVMREECFEMEEPGLFNGFMRGLKHDLLAGNLGGDRREMWWRVRQHRLGLLQKSAGGGSDIGEEEAKEFLSAQLIQTT